MIVDKQSCRTDGVKVFTVNGDYSSAAENCREGTDVVHDRIRRVKKWCPHLAHCTINDKCHILCNTFFCDERCSANERVRGN